jgi:glycosyltransferase involved in cell wall biosynthesis
MGACGTRNRALSLAQGTYIQFLDADDLLAPDKILQQLKRADNGSDARTLLTSAFGKFFFCPERAKFRPDSLWQDLAPVNWLLKKFTDNVWMNPATWLVSRRLTELAGPWDERLSGDDDGEYMCRLVARSEKVKFVPEAKCYYRIGNVGSLSWKKSEEALSSYFLATCLCIEHLRSLEESERTRLACVKYLQTNLFCFYPEEVEIVNKAREVARNLGGDLVPRPERFRFLLFRKMFGLKSAKTMRNRTYRAKLAAVKSWDKLLYNLLYKMDNC